MPVKIQNSFAATTPVGDALNNAITSYANNIPTYGEVQQGRVNANKADAPQQIGDAIKSLYGQSGAPGQQLTPQMVQASLPDIAKATMAGGSLDQLGPVLRAVIANSANPQGVQMIDRAQEGAGQAYGTTQTGTHEKEANDLTKVQMQQDGAMARAQMSARMNQQAVKDAEKMKGKQDFEQVLGDLKGLYTGLDANGGAVNTKDSMIHNAMARIANSDTGQTVNKMLGTENQSARNQIAAKLPLLSAAIKSATGMSSQQLNSNFELQQYMKALTSPGADIQANLATIAALSKQFGTGGLAGGDAPPGPSGAPAGVDASGAIVSGGGGNKAPGDASWTDPSTGTVYQIGPDGQPYE